MCLACWDSGLLRGRLVCVSELASRPAGILFFSSTEGLMDSTHI